MLLLEQDSGYKLMCEAANKVSKSDKAVTPFAGVKAVPASLCALATALYI